MSFSIPSGIRDRRAGSNPYAVTCKHVPDTRVEEIHRERGEAEENEPRGNGGAHSRGEKDSFPPTPILRLYICFPLFFPGRATARERPGLVSSRITLSFLAPLSSPSPRALLFPYICLSSSRFILRAANARCFLLSTLPPPPTPSLPLRLCLEMWHSTGLPRCLRWCGIRAGLPLRAWPRGGGCIGEMMRRLAGSSQKPPPSRLLAHLLLLFLLYHHPLSSPSFHPLPPSRALP